MKLPERMAVKMEGASPPVFEPIFRNARFAQGGNALFEGKVAGSPRPRLSGLGRGCKCKEVTSIKGCSMKLPERMAVKMEGASPAVFEQIFRNARFAQGGNALFEEKVAGSPHPQVVRTRKGLQMQGSEKHQMMYDEASGKVVWTRKGLQMQGSEKHQMMYDEASGKVSLLIKAIGPGDEGEYTCTALNPYGEAICTVYISPEATKAVKKSRSSHKLHKSKSGHDQQMLQQQQQQQ